MVTIDFNVFKKYITTLSNVEVYNLATKYKIGQDRMIKGNIKSMVEHPATDDITKNFIALMKKLRNICETESKDTIIKNTKEADKLKKIILELNSISPTLGVKADLVLRFYYSINRDENTILENKMLIKLIKKIKHYFNYYLRTGKMPYKYPAWFCRDMMAMMNGFTNVEDKDDTLLINQTLFEGCLDDIDFPLVYSEQYTDKFWNLSGKDMRVKLNDFTTAIANSFGENGLILNQQGQRYWIKPPEMCFLEFPLADIDETFVNYKIEPFITTALYNRRINHPVLYKFNEFFLPIVAVLTFLASFLAVIIPLTV